MKKEKNPPTKKDREEAERFLKSLEIEGGEDVDTLAILLRDRGCSEADCRR